MTASTFAAALADRLLAGLPPEQPLTRMLLASFPASVAHYLDRWLAQHVGRVEATLASPWVEETDEVAATRQALVAAMQHHAQVPAERCDQVVRYAVGRVVSHLIRPGDALVKTIEESGAGPYSADAIAARLDWFTSHAALAEVVASYFDWKGTDVLSANELRRLVRQIDQRLAQEESPSEWVAHLAPLFDLADVLGQRRVPAALVRAHLDARNLGIGALFGVEPDHPLSEAELLAMLQDDPLTLPSSIDIEDDDPGFRAAPPEDTPTVSLPAEEGASDAALEPFSAPDLLTPETSTTAAAVAGTVTDATTEFMEPAEADAVPREDATEWPAPLAAASDAEPEETASDEEAPSSEALSSGAPSSEALSNPLAVTPAPGIAPPTEWMPLPDAEGPSEDDESAMDSFASDSFADDSFADEEASEAAPDRQLAPISDALDALAPSESDATPESEPEALAPTDNPMPDGPPATIEEATRDDQPLWTRYAAPPTPSVNDQFATPDEVSDAPPEAEDDNEDVPLWRRFFTGGDSGPTVSEADAESPSNVFQDEPVPEKSSAEGPAAEHPMAGEPTPTEPVAEEPVLTEPAPEKPDTIDLGALDVGALEQRLLGPAADQRSWFVAQLTEGDEDAYDATLRALDAAGSWTEASQIIARDIFRRYRVNIYSAPAIAFTDAVETHFRTQRA